MDFERVSWFTQTNRRGILVDDIGNGGAYCLLIIASLHASDPEPLDKIPPDGGASCENVSWGGMGQLAFHEPGLQLRDESLVLCCGLVPILGSRPSQSGRGIGTGGAVAV
jgi:hypothetical protein